MSSSNIVPTRLRQIALVTSDLSKAKETISYILGTELLYTDPLVSQWGLENALYALGGDVLEIVSPVKKGTTAGRLLQKRGDGGYMIIMQTSDAAARRNLGLAKVIFTHETDESVCVQYHPKGIKGWPSKSFQATFINLFTYDEAKHAYIGGVIPELDSHVRTRANPEPLASPFSPWHACGPSSLYSKYSSIMARNSYLRIDKVLCRLAPGDDDIEGAAKQWETLFGITIDDVGTGLQFLNARMEFVSGGLEGAEGIESITLGVTGRDKLEGILQRAKDRGLYNEGEWVGMLGIKWYFDLLEPSPKLASKL